MTTVLRYPYEAITEKTDYLQITIKSYPNTGTSEDATNSLIEGAGFGSIGSVATAGKTKASVAQLAENGVILLPMPSNIQDLNSVSYGEDTLDPLGAFAGGAAKDLMGVDLAAPESLVDQISKKAGSIGNKLRGLGEGSVIIDAYLRNLAAQAASITGASITAEQLLTRATGDILNPNMELLFKGPTLRSFSFSFKMTPRDESESLQVKSIIRSLKKNMAPITGTENNFLKTPNIFELAYRKGNTNHPFLPRFKQCALTDMTVNYTGEGVYASYRDGTPISMVMNLTFRELVPIYAEDYADNPSLTYNPEGGTYGVGY